MIKIVSVLLTLLLTVAYGKSTEKLQYVFFYGSYGLNQLRGRGGIPIEYLRKTVIAAEAPGWKLGFACKTEHTDSIPTMYKTDNMSDLTKGLAIPMNSSMIEVLDEQHYHKDLYKRVEIYVKNADLGPI